MKSYTDLEQSKRLAEFLPLESADMWYWEFPTASTYNGYGYPMFHRGEGIRNVPCWSLVALLDVVSEEVSLNSFKNGNWNAMVRQNGKMIFSDANNPVDACVSMIKKLHELNLL